MKTTADIRQAFLDFFAERDHRVVPSSSLVPGNDPTLLFTNAGMVQFKDVFLGSEKRAYSRAASSQRCVRAGGKHNDLENVGYTARHHTFFEMLGNFSFGDYFKKEAIEFAWEFLTGTCGFPAEKLWVTVYDEDDEAAVIWLDHIGVDPARLSRIGDKPGKRFESDNFWAMGDTGPCGPCTEIFYDHGPEVPGGPPGSPDEDGDRYIEIWNLVFMQFDRGSDGEMSPLPAPCVDTGMGLERLAAILQGGHSNYDIDLFQHLIGAAQRFTGASDPDSPSLKVIADHIRACAFLIVDGVLPANEGRGYVLRRIIRRAIRHGYKLECKDLFFSKMVAPLVDVMGEAYPELLNKQEFVAEVLEREERKFFRTLTKGMSLADSFINDSFALLQYAKKEFGWENPGLNLQGMGYYLDVTDNLSDHKVGARLFDSKSKADLVEAHRLIWTLRELNEDGRGDWKSILLFFYGQLDSSQKFELQTIASDSNVLNVKVSERVEDLISPFREISGELAFKLYDTFGFPYDLTADICRERGFIVDRAGFERKMAEQRERARKANKFSVSYEDRLIVSDAASADFTPGPTKFVGYDQLKLEGAKVRLILVDGKEVDFLSSGQKGTVILDSTPFYAESGGQVGDTGFLSGVDFRARVTNTIKVGNRLIGHIVEVEHGKVLANNSVNAVVDADRRADIVRHHSATHLLHSALRTVLGEHVQQKGSLVAPDRLRFDFSHHEPVSEAQIQHIERLVNEQIQANAAADVQEMSYDDAISAGALAFFGDKYGDEVRVLKFGEFSTELCGGTHVSRVGDIGVFKIIGETGISAGVRRIEAVAGQVAVEWLQNLDRTVRDLAGRLKTSPEQVGERVDQMLERSRQLEKELERLKSKLTSAAGSDLASQAVEVAGIRLISARLEGVDPNGLRDTVDQLKNKLGSGIIVLGTASGDGVRLAAGVTADLTGKIKAGELVNHVASQVGGKGGGRPDFAQAGGTDASSLPEALASVAEWVRERAEG